jgi:hypothetical protein
MNLKEKRRLQEFRSMCCKLYKTDTFYEEIPDTTTTTTTTTTTNSTTDTTGTTTTTTNTTDSTTTDGTTTTSTTTDSTTTDGTTTTTDLIKDFRDDPKKTGIDDRPKIPTDLRESPFPPYPPPRPKIPTDLRESPFPPYPPPDVSLKDMFPYTEPPGSIVSFPPKPPAPKDPTIDVPIPPNPPDDPNDNVPIPPTPPPTSLCPQLHPNTNIAGFSQVDTIDRITKYINSKGYRHDPDGIPWIRREDWIPWDGVTTVNPCTATKQQIQKHVFPTGINTMRGLREVFYKTNPFKDNSYPTPQEIENWNIVVIRHFRNLLGYNQSTHPVSNDKCTYLKAAWAEERYRTNFWDATYPGTLDGKTGPCTKPYSSNAHCGAGFMPNASDQSPYLCPTSMSPCTNTSGAEGYSTHNTDIPWSIKLTRVIGGFLNSDGIGAHTGPFVGREYFGSAWYMDGGSIGVRTKWSGKNNFTCS